MNKNSSNNLEIERKYIIEMPDFALISAQGEYTKSDILQIYLSAEGGQTRRIRRREYQDKTVYIETVKIRVDRMSSREIENEISKEEFDRLSAQIREGSKPLYKTRHTFNYLGNTIEIDVYPQWQSTDVMETELDGYDVEIALPPFINVIKEVTGNKAYSNSSMASHFPPEREFD